MDEKTKQAFLEAYKYLESAWFKVGNIECGGVKCEECPIKDKEIIPCKLGLLK
jgi:hypothetical protein